MPDPTKEQLRVLDNEKKNMIVSASAGSGKTWVLIELIKNLIVNRRVPVRKLLVLTFTRAAAGEMRERLNKALLSQASDSFILEQIDDLSICDVSTIDAFCEKLVKRNIERLPLDEHFSLLENTSQLRRQAFEEALNNLEEAQLKEIYYSFRKNKDLIFNAVEDIDSLLSVEVQEGKLDFYLKSQPVLFEKALKTLNAKLIEDLNKLRNKLKLMENQVSSEPSYALYCQTLANLLSGPIKDNFIHNVRNFQLIELPSLPVVRGERRDETMAQKIKSMRKEIELFLAYFKKFNFENERLLEKQKSGTLAVALMNLYKNFCVAYKEQKQKLDALDFNDIERLTLKLLEEEDILNSLQDQYDYIFVDEYQDTNRIQEAIIKPITRRGHFVAVGDPKQGIYGFRNATMEIMQDDVATFLNSEEGTVEYLRGNWRSDSRILDFINQIFEKVMTEEVVGFSYKDTSMLSCEAFFEKTKLPAVQVCVVEEENEGIDKKEKKLYSVQEDNLYVEEKHQLEVATIVSQIDELLMQRIYDEKKKEFRKVEFDDIAVLFRGRSSLMTALSKQLSQRGYPVLSDVKDVPIDEPEVQMLVGLLKLLLNRDDDISLLAVMSSPFGGFTMEELSQIKLMHPSEATFFNAYSLCEEETKIKVFNQMLNTLKLMIEVNGLEKSLVQLMTEKSYFAYLKNQESGENKLRSVYNFLQDIKPFERDIPSAIAFMEKTGGRKRSTNAAGAGAIKLMTIHASKGLEYPIVILADAGKKLESVNHSNYALNSQFGLATYVFDEKNNLRFTSPNLEAVRLQNRRKEMIDELMIFYVALTRAKNHLYIIGSEKLANLFSMENFDPFEAKNYLAIIFSVFNRKLTEELALSGKAFVGDFVFNHVSKILDFELGKETISKLQLEKENLDKLEEYFNFQYPHKEIYRTVKNSVTGLNEDKQKIFIEKIESNEERQDFIMLGNAYHEAMRYIDFDKIQTKEDVEKELKKNIQKFTEGYVKILDTEIVYRNIIKIKALVGNAPVYKEKQFVMQLALREIGIDSDDEVLVQGVVDFFSLGDDNILIDYKFTQENNSQKILKKYGLQLRLYSKAIEKAFDIKLNKKYILSLRNSELIEFLD